MAFHRGDLMHELLAGSHRHYHHYTSGGSSSGGGSTEWWVWLVLALSAIVLIWGIAKKFSSD
ncbi:hypothetical protein [Streptomyces sp. NPDC048248]|uniref:hypothetical protein n=1 Tax=Streptomyces sp. NPDC048248 TaxID=3365523 RepID=UPI00371B17F8